MPGSTMPSAPHPNLLSYLGTHPELAGPPRHVGANSAVVGRITLGRDAWLDVPADLVVPAAVSYCIDDHAAQRIRARLTGPPEGPPACAVIAGT